MAERGDTQTAGKIDDMIAAAISAKRGTLRAALNAAIPEGLIEWNPAKHVEMPPAERPKPLVWTQERVDEWLRTGRVPSRVMICTPEQTGRFLDHAVHDRLYPLYLLVAHRGLRRGEACGVRRPDLDLDEGFLDVSFGSVSRPVIPGWKTGGLIFTESDGSALHRAEVTEHSNFFAAQAWVAADPAA